MHLKPTIKAETEVDSQAEESQFQHPQPEAKVQTEDLYHLL